MRTMTLPWIDGPVYEVRTPADKTRGMARRELQDRVSRPPATFWHNIAEADETWWAFLVAQSQIATGFDESPGDEGEQILKSYIAGDHVIAYATGHGAVGWAELDGPGSYRLLPLGHEQDLLSGHNRHRLTVRWQAVAPKLTRAIPATEILRRFEISHPLSTSSRIRKGDPEGLIRHLSMVFGAPAHRQNCEAVTCPDTPS